ncbi:MAG: tyrosine-type recombinase/integrase [Spirochaetales bacterium]|nr:tyrosine-type recombinase/integrase [Spirochaetales bacterium]
MTETKNHEKREVIIPEELEKKLEVLSERNGGGFHFSNTAGLQPVHVRNMRRSLVRAYEHIGIRDKVRIDRGLCFHSWRHYLNTTLRSNNITDGKLRAMVRHSGSQMTEHYTHFKASDYEDIKKVQAKILKFGKVV